MTKKKVSKKKTTKKIKKSLFEQIVELIESSEESFYNCEFQNFMIERETKMYNEKAKLVKPIVTKFNKGFEKLCVTFANSVEKLKLDDIDLDDVYNLEEVLDNELIKVGIYRGW